MRRNGTQLRAVAASLVNRKGGRAPGQTWVGHALTGYQCEGLDPLGPADRRLFSPQHVGHIERGDPYLRKTWRLEDGTEFQSRHCRACGEQLEITALESVKPLRTGAP